MILLLENGNETNEPTQVYMHAEAHSSTSIQRNTVLLNLINFHFLLDNPRICIEQATSINQTVDISRSFDYVSQLFFPLCYVLCYLFLNFSFLLKPATGRFILNLTCFGSFKTRLNENRRAFHRIPIRISSGKHFRENDQRGCFNGDDLLSSRLIEQIGRDGAREKRKGENEKVCVCVCVCLCAREWNARQSRLLEGGKRGRKCYTLREREFIFFIFKLLNEKKKTKRSDKLFLCYYVSFFFFILTSKWSNHVYNFCWMKGNVKRIIIILLFHAQYCYIYSINECRTLNTKKSTSFHFYEYPL